MTWLKNGFEAIVSYSLTSLFIGIGIALLSLANVFVSKKILKGAIGGAIAACTVLLLFVQAEGSKRAAATAKTDLQLALQKQREDLTSAFKTGTDQVIKATSDTAKQTRKTATDQTNAIKHQAADQFTQLQSVTLGTSMCPIVQAGFLPNTKNGQISVSNYDPKKLNMYDIRVELTEYGPDQTSGHNEHWDNVLQIQPVNFPLLPSGRASYAPVTFLSKMTDIHVTFTVTTRTAICGGSIDLFDTGKKGWVIDRILEYTGGTTLTNYNQHLSPGLANSKLDPQSSEGAPRNVP